MCDPYLSYCLAFGNRSSEASACGKMNEMITEQVGNSEIFHTHQIHSSQSILSESESYLGHSVRQTQHEDVAKLVASADGGVIEHAACGEPARAHIVHQNEEPDA